MHRAQSHGDTHWESPGRTCGPSRRPVGTRPACPLLAPRGFRRTSPARASGSGSIIWLRSAEPGSPRPWMPQGQLLGSPNPVSHSSAWILGDHVRGPASAELEPSQPRRGYFCFACVFPTQRSLNTRSAVHPARTFQKQVPGATAGLCLGHKGLEVWAWLVVPHQWFPGGLVAPQLQSKGRTQEQGPQVSSVP